VQDLQFQKAEFSPTTQKCSTCAGNLEASYFKLAGKPVCILCAERIQARQLRPRGSAVLRGILWGAGAAVACGIVYAILTTLTGASFALASIAVGYVVGRSVRIGSRGLGGRRCQAAAVLLTYFAICAGYMPTLYGAIEKSEQKVRAEKLSSQGPSSPEKALPQGAVTTIRFVLRTFLVSVFSLAAPFLGLVTGVGGIIGFFIVFIGLYEAWKLTARDRRVLAGPFSLTPEGEL
jgi:hypothetical protein